MRTLAVLVILGNALTAAHADATYEAQAQGAHVVNRVEDLVWALTATCEVGADRNDVQARQCRLLRDTRAAQLRAQPLLVEAESTAFSIGDFDAAKKSALTTVDGCIRCKPVTVEGKQWSVYAGAPKALNYDRARTFPDAAALAAWKSALGETRVHYVIKIGARRPTAPTLAFDVVGFRVVSACTGEILASSAPAQPLAPNKRACSAK